MLRCSSLANQFRVSKWYRERNTCQDFNATTTYTNRGLINVEIDSLAIVAKV